jgi:glutaconate CoA-transferase subunit B
MMFDSAKGRFRLASTHPGVTIEEVQDNTGFAFDCPEIVVETRTPPPEDLALIRGEIAAKIADPYPKFARAVFGIGAEAA